MMTQIRGSSNAKAKRELGWQPRGRAGARASARLATPARRRPSVRSAHDREPEADLTESIEELRPLLFSIAYRMLGSVSEAEDVVQEAFLRYHRALRDGRRDRVAARPTCRPSPRGSASTTCARRGPGARPTSGEWLPEPLLTDGRRAGPGRARRGGRLALDGVPARCSSGSRPVERAVFLLHDVFDYGYDEIAAHRRQERGRTAASSRCGPAGT